MILGFYRAACDSHKTDGLGFQSAAYELQVTGLAGVEQSRDGWPEHP